MSYVVYVILFLSLNACNSRSLGLYIDKGDIIGKDVHKSNLHSTFATSKVQHFESEELQSQESHIAEIGQSKMPQTSACAIAVKGKPSEETLNEKIIEGWRRRQALSTSGFVAHDVEEPADSNEKDITEDVVVMDYAQPHRKPPIHNIKD